MSNDDEGGFMEQLTTAMLKPILRDPEPHVWFRFRDDGSVHWTAADESHASDIPFDVRDAVFTVWDDGHVTWTSERMGAAGTFPSPPDVTSGE